LSGEQVTHPPDTDERSADWAEEAVAEAETHEDPELAQYALGGATLSLEEQVLARIDRQRRRKAKIKEERITLAHGAGGKATHTLIDALFLESFRNPVLEAMEDQATLSVKDARLAFTTDSFVVHPLFFPGGNIGDLAVNGTVNDLAVGGAFEMRARFRFEQGRVRKELPVQADDCVRPGARGGAMQNVKFVFAIDFRVRFIESDNVAKRISGVDYAATFIFCPDVEGSVIGKSIR